jgi:hypothetical protein
MKTLLSSSRVALLSLLAISISFSACRKDEEEISITAEDARDIVASGLSDNSEALEEQSLRTAQLNTAALDSLCGDGVAYNINFRLTRNSRTFDYDANGVRDGICTNDSLIAFQITSTFTTRFIGPNYSSNGTGDRNGRLNEIRSDSTFYLWTGNTNKTTNGTLETRRETYQINSTLKYSSSIKIDKTIRRIVGGTTDYILNGGGDNVRDFSYSGTITYLGNRQAEITVNGNSYTVFY